MWALLFVLFDKPGARDKSVLQNCRENEIARMEKKRDEYGSMAVWQYGSMAVFSKGFSRGFPSHFVLKIYTINCRVSLVLVDL